MLTASKLELARECPGSFSLPRTREDNEYSEAGIDLHGEREAAINRAEIPDALAARWPGLSWRAEVAYGVDVATGAARELGVGIGRAYPTDGGEFEIFGTADVVGISDEALVVVEWKSFDPNVSVASKNAQLAIAACAFARIYGRDLVVVALHHELRPLDVHELDVVDLDTFAVEAKRIVIEARPSADPVLREGPHCRWCEAFHACPKKQALAADVRDLVSTPERVEAMIPFQSDEDAADAYEFADRVRMFLRRLDAALYARAKERPIPLRSGKLFGQVEKLGAERLDGDVTYEVVRAKHGQAIADTAVIRSATKVRLKEALGFVAPKGALASLERDVLDEIRARGGAKREKKTVIDEYEPRPALADGGAK